MSQGALVFVYGTLRRGASNAVRMAGAEYVAAGTVRGALYRIDWYPGLVLGADGTVRGEVFRVDANLLDALDDYEGGEYCRVVATVTLDDGSQCEAWVWEYREAGSDESRIASGDWMV